MDETRLMTYAEAASTLGIQLDSVKRRARNRRWHREKGNDGLVRIAVPFDAIPSVKADNPPDYPANYLADIIRLEKEVSSLQTEVCLLREAHADLKTDRDVWRVAAVQRRRSWWPFSF